MIIGVKRALVCEYGDAGKGCVFVLCDSGARVFIAEYDSISALQTCMKGFQMASIECVVSQIDRFVSSKGNFNIMAATEAVTLKVRDGRYSFLGVMRQLKGSR